MKWGQQSVPSLTLTLPRLEGNRLADQQSAAWLYLLPLLSRRHPPLAFKASKGLLGAARGPPRTICLVNFLWCGCLLSTLLRRAKYPPQALPLFPPHWGFTSGLLFDSPLPPDKGSLHGPLWCHFPLELTCPLALPVPCCTALPRLRLI